MKIEEKESFMTLLANVLAFYRQPFNEFAGAVWWEALKGYDYPALAQAFNRHAVNPDNGQFPPKPADIVRMIGGTSGDAALVAWSKVERAVRSIGQYEGVIFDDALIHRVIDDMGGWVKACSCQSEDDFIFVGKEFQNRYRGFAMRSERPEYPAGLLGLAQAHNLEHGTASRLQYRMLGDLDKCRAVYQSGKGSDANQIAMLEVSNELHRLAIPGIETK